jgi:hypothetical protein
MTSGQSHRIVEEEQRGPSLRSIERLVEVLELGMTDDPKGTVVMTFQSSVVINKTATIPGEQTTCRNSMKITPRVNSVPASHPSPVCSGTDANKWTHR